MMRSAPAAALRSAISSGAVAIMGDAPSAMVALADCVVTTVFVIWRLDGEWGVCAPWSCEMDGALHTWWTSGECCLTASRRTPAALAIEPAEYVLGEIEKETIGFVLNAWTTVAIFLAALKGSLDATMSLTIANPSNARPEGDTDPWRQ